MPTVEASINLKRSVIKVIFHLILFVLIYLTLFGISLSLSIFLIIKGSLIIINNLNSSLFEIIGIGLISLGISIVYFLLRFFFQKKVESYPIKIEITKTTEPKLFAIIDEIVNDLKVAYPKKVILIPSVNAAVYYSTNFWSFFLPIKKNLAIGLGLINAVTDEELKGILAHEFGHFSQKSTKFNTYFYVINKIIYDIVNDNDSYKSAIVNFSKGNKVWLFICKINFFITDIIRSILQFQYRFISKSFYELSREMEFNADEVAASFVGLTPIRNSLLRFSLADHAFNEVANFYQSQEFKYKSKNIYENHSFLINYYAKDAELAFENNLPIVTQDVLKKYNKSKLIIEDQWASHPSEEARINHLLEKWQPEIARATGLGNDLFLHIEEYQKDMTEKLFNEIKEHENAQIIDKIKFEELFTSIIKENEYPPIYNRFYDYINPTSVDVETNDLTFKRNLNELFSIDKVELVNTFIALQNDISVIELIENTKHGIKIFEYDGKKYQKDDAGYLLIDLRKEFKLLEKEVKNHQQLIYNSFAAIEKQNGSEELKLLYQDFLKFDKGFESRISLVTEILECINKTGTLNEIQYIHMEMQILYDKEKIFKRDLAEILPTLNANNEKHLKLKETIDLYLNRKIIYFENNRYNEDNLIYLHDILNKYAIYMHELYIIYKRKILNYQSNILKTALSY